MNKWQETVKRISKLHPGKSLKTILPLAKVEYKKMGHSSSTKKVEKLRGLALLVVFVKDAKLKNLRR